MADFNNITLALAGIFQSAQHVNNLANHGTADDRVIEPLVKSLIKLNAKSCIDVYEDISNLRPGLKLVDTQLRTGANGKSANLGRYMATLLNLERHFSRSAEMTAVVATRIVQIKRLLDHVPLMDESIVHSFAELYKDTISTLPIRIQVIGEQSYLGQPKIQDKVRCCLLCAMRSAVLWRQMGGKRRQLIMNRKLIIRTAKELISVAHI